MFDDDYHSSVVGRYSQHAEGLLDAIEPRFSKQSAHAEISKLYMIIAIVRSAPSAFVAVEEQKLPIR